MLDAQNFWGKGLETQRKSFFLLEDGELSHAHPAPWQHQRRRITEQANFFLCYYFPLEVCYTDGGISYKEGYLSGKVMLSVGLFLKSSCIQRILSSSIIPLWGCPHWQNTCSTVRWSIKNTGGVLKVFYNGWILMVKAAGTCVIRGLDH